MSNASSVRYVVLDLETQKGFSDVDRKKFHLLKVSVVGLYDSQTDSYQAYEEKEISKVEEILKQADLIIGFNIIDFDMVVLAPYLLTPIENFPVLDLLTEFEKSRGHRISLQSLAQATLKTSKSGTGLEAISLYRDGKINELKKYCLDDVRITKEIYEYGLKHKKLFFVSNRDYQTHEAAVSWENAVEDLKKQKKTESSFPTSLF